MRKIQMWFPIKHLAPMEISKTMDAIYGFILDRGAYRNPPELKKNIKHWRQEWKRMRRIQAIARYIHAYSTV